MIFIVNDKLLLHKAIDSDILEADVLENVYFMAIKEKVLSIHRYTITEPKDLNSRWQTYITGEDNRRKKISAVSEKALLDKLYEYYFKTKAVALQTLYPEWINLRFETGVSPRTVSRNQNHWEKYYRQDKIVTVPLEKLDAELIERFFYSCIKKHQVTVKELGNMKFIMVDMLKLAKRRKLVTYNPMLDVDIKLNGCRPQKKHNDTSRVYLPNEIVKLFEALNKERISKPECTDTYGVFLLFKLGLRIGELVALKWSDIDMESNELHIHRMETKDINSQGKIVPSIAEYTKKKSSYGDRFLPLSEYEMDIFAAVRQINSDNGYGEDDFIFCDANGRTKIREIDNLIRKCCNMANIEVKSAHDIRRTVASEMFGNGVNVEIIRNYLGHSDIKTTFGYILDNQGKSETNRLILNSLSDMNGLIRTQNV